MPASNTAVDIGGRTLSSCPTSTRCSTPRPGFTKGEVIDYYARIAPGAARPPRRPRHHACAASRTASTTSRSSRSAARRTGPSGCRRRPVPATAAAPSTTAGSTDVAALVWAANMAALELHAPMARCDDIETPTMVVFDLDPGAPAGHPRVRRGRPAGSATSLDGSASSASPRRRARRGSSSTCRSTRRTPTSRRRRSPSPSPRCSRSTTRSGCVTTHGQGSSRQGKVLHRLEPEQPPQDDDLRLLAAGPARADGVDAGHLGRGRRPPPTAAPLSFEAADVLDRVDEHGDLFEPTVTEVQHLPAARPEPACVGRLPASSVRCRRRTRVPERSRAQAWNRGGTEQVLERRQALTHLSVPLRFRSPLSVAD